MNPNIKEADRKREAHVPAGTTADSLAAYESALGLHRRNAPSSEVYFLERMCFRLEQTADAAGVRYVLWQPLAIFLEFGFKIEKMAELCDGHLELVFVEHSACPLIEKMMPLIDQERRKQPQTMERCGLQVMVHLAEILSEDFLHPAYTEKISRMNRQYKSAVRSGKYSGVAALRAQIAELCLEVTEAELRNCIEFLRAARDGWNWPEGTAGMASEASLGRDWLKPEEEEAWSYL